MPDTIVVKGSSDSKYKNHSEGQFSALCVDTIDVGERVVTFPGRATEIRPKCALVYRTGELNVETGELIDISKEMTISMFETATMRSFLEDWRGKSYTTEQVEQGLQLDKLVGQWALISIEQKESKKGRPYSVIKSIAPLPNAMPRPAFPAYERPAYWAERKAEYASEVKAYRDALGTNASGDFTAPPPAETDDELPF